MYFSQISVIYSNGIKIFNFKILSEIIKIRIIFKKLYILLLYKFNSFNSLKLTFSNILISDILFSLK